MRGADLGRWDGQGKNWQQREMWQGDLPWDDIRCRAQPGFQLWDIVSTGYPAATVFRGCTGTTALRSQERGRSAQGRVRSCWAGKSPRKVHGRRKWAPSQNQGRPPGVANTGLAELQHFKQPPNAQRREIWACATCPYIWGGVWELVVHLMSGSQMGEPSLVLASESLHRENGRASRLIAKAPQPRPSDLRSCKAARIETQSRA